MKKIKYSLNLLLIFFSLSICSQNIQIKGKVTDVYGEVIPFAAVGIVKKNIGTTTTTEGTFSFIISVNELNEFLEISSIGFETFKINIRDYINNPIKIILNEKLTELNEVILLSPIHYVKTSFKKLRDNSLSSTHQLNVIYRRWSVEDDICRFFIEQYLNIIDRGPASEVIKFNVNQSRKSSEYRFIKNKQRVHAAKYMEWNNPLRKGINIKSYNWKKIEISTYDGEDVIIIEGTNKKSEKLKFYIGYDTYRIYRIEMSKIPQEMGKELTATYLYKKNSKGKLYLGYHSREWKGAAAMPENVKRAMSASGQKFKNFVPLAYRHEVFVIELIENKEKFTQFEDNSQKDMTLYNVKYDEKFWNNISLPAETNFYKKNIKELESLYNVPIKTQFQYSNKN